MPRIISNLSSHKGFSLREFKENCNKILIIMDSGGLGDVFIHRMLFEDIKTLMPNINITFACCKKYIEAIEDHPFIDEIIDLNQVDKNKFLLHYQTGRVCTKYEMEIAPLSKLHRSDILANYLGFDLKKHNMHINLDEKYVEQAKKRLNNNKINFAICPISGISSKNITIKQIKTIKEKIDSLNANLYCIHNEFIPEINDLGISIWNDLSIKQWMGALSAADYVISVDTAAFHYCGGINKPLLGIFSFTDGKIYGKYYDFILVQKHRDEGNWDCGPCYNWTSCCKTNNNLKPCISELSSELILSGIDNLVKKYKI